MFCFVFFLRIFKRQISVCHPTFYANRFIEFMTQKVFKKASTFTTRFFPSFSSVATLLLLSFIIVSLPFVFPFLTFVFRFSVPIAMPFLSIYIFSHVYHIDLSSIVWLFSSWAFCVLSMFRLEYQIHLALCFLPSFSCFRFIRPFFESKIKNPKTTK